jgi:hypothetical protein
MFCFLENLIFRQRGDMTCETKADKGRPAKGAKKASTRQHGRQSWRRTLNFGRAGTGLCQGLDKMLYVQAMGPAHCAECTRTQQECDNLTPGPKLPPSGAAKDLLFNPN